VERVKMSDMNEGGIFEHVMAVVLFVFVEPAIVGRSE
jgi:hypothetical protein